MCVVYCAFSLCPFVLCIPERVRHMINQSVVRSGLPSAHAYMMNLFGRGSWLVGS